MLLYLSQLDHGHLHSEGELSRAINDCYRSYGSAVDLGTWYGQSLSAGGTAHTVAVVRERRAWALRIAADLAHRHPYDHNLPWCSGVTLSTALQPGHPQRTARPGRRAFLAAAPVIGLYLVISCLGEQAKTVMGMPVVGSLNVGLLLGLVQLVAVAAWVQWYARFCGTSIDSLVANQATPGERLERRP
ncbi:DUF485 domain-containing protein [Streptomyces scabiei]|uniref:DUF485 domain-containing protein n=1 Tax=Streptomyces scabiei TaxID=1930 RepID=UPI0029B549C7|nr:DUF485 domain-containing protein [Streptomyces scabiei]MDX3523635.1 DUF485 domain-containing protein [Streptomyces scabiei]